MYMHYTSFFSVNSAVTVIMSSGDQVFEIYDMVIIRHHFSVNSAVMVIMSFGDHIFEIYDMVIIRHHFSVQIQP